MVMSIEIDYSFMKGKRKEEIPVIFMIEIFIDFLVDKRIIVDQYNRDLGNVVD